MVTVFLEKESCGGGRVGITISDSFFLTPPTTLPALHRAYLYTQNLLSVRILNSCNNKLFNSFEYCQ
jgi:hypothetical protein